MNLESYQRGLFQLITQGDLDPESSSYLRQLVGTSRLSVVHEAVCFWRAYAIENLSILVSDYLHGTGRFDAVVRQFVSSGEFSPFLEEAGMQFLHMLSHDTDAIVAALAKTEMALHLTRANTTAEVYVDWPCDPEPLLAAILAKQEMVSVPTPRPQNHRMRIARSLHRGYSCEPAE